MGRRRWWRALGALAVLSAALTCVVGTAHDASALALPPKGSTPGEYVATAGGSLLEGLGNGGAAVAARLDDPSGVAVNANGDVFIADANDNMVREVLPSGLIEDFAGTGVAGYYGDGGPAYNAQLDHPEGVAVDAAGDVFIADTDNNVIREVNTFGVITTVAGDGTAGFSGDGGTPTSAELDLPTAVAVNQNGYLAIADTGNDVVRVVYQRVLVTAPRAGLGGTDVVAERTHSASPNGPISFPTFTVIETEAGEWDTPGDAGDGGYGVDATLEYPTAVAWDATGTLIDIADTGNSAVRQLNFNTNRIAALFHVPYPTGVSVAPDGAVVVSDPTDHVVDRWTNALGLVRIIGTGVDGNSGVGGLAKDAQLSYPRGVNVDQYGDVFVTDAQNQNVRELVVARKPQFLTDTPSLVSAPSAPYAYDFIVGAVPQAHVALSGAPSWLTLNTATWPNATLTGTLPAGVVSFTYSVVASNVYGVTTAGPFRVTVPQLSSYSGVDGPVDVIKGPNNLLWSTSYANNSIVEMTLGGITRSFTAPLVKGPFSIANGLGGLMWFTDSTGNSIGRITVGGAIHVFTGAGIDDPFGIALGPDGDMWFTNHANNTIGRITPTGVVTIFPSPLIKGPEGITSGPNNSMYFTNNANNTIGRISMSGSVAAIHSATISGPTSIVEGPDLALWFDNSTGLSIGRVTATGVVTSYSSGLVFDPQGITVGPDHALWFTNAGNDTIGRVTTTGVVSAHGGFGIAVPEGITAGADGALWFCDFGTSNIGRMTLAGATSFYADTVDPHDITLGPDGALWFTLPSTNSIGRISTAGAITTYLSPYIDNPDGITTGPDGNLWFTNYSSDYVDRITPTGSVTGFSDPSVDGATSITSGLFGELWFTNYLGDSIGQITTAGVITSETGTTVDGPYSIVESGGVMWFTNLLGNSIGSFDQYGDLGNDTTSGVSEPYGITAGSDGNVWFTNLTGNSIGVVTPAGAVFIVHDPSISTPVGITTGPDGAIWFANTGGSTVGRSTTTAFVTHYPVPAAAHPLLITAGPDYALWFTLPSANAIGRVTG